MLDHLNLVIVVVDVSHDLRIIVIVIVHAHLLCHLIQLLSGELNFVRLGQIGPRHIRTDSATATVSIGLLEPVIIHSFEVVAVTVVLFVVISVSGPVEHRGGPASHFPVICVPLNLFDFVLVMASAESGCVESAQTVMDLWLGGSCL